MERQVIPRGDHEKPEPGKGAWSKVKTPAGYTVVIACPRCGRSCCLDHTIDALGNVEPSLLCPRGCEFHAFVRLEDWEG